MAKVKIEHELLESKIATAAALFNEWITWCKANGINGTQMSHITDAFRVTPEQAAEIERKQKEGSK